MSISEISSGVMRSPEPLWRDLSKRGWQPEHQNWDDEVDQEPVTPVQHHGFQVDRAKSVGVGFPQFQAIGMGFVKIIEGKTEGSIAQVLKQQR